MTLTCYCYRSATVQGSEQEERALQHKFKQVAAIPAVMVTHKCLRPSVSVPTQQTSSCSAAQYEYGGIQLSLQGKYSSLHRTLSALSLCGLSRTVDVFAVIPGGQSTEINQGTLTTVADEGVGFNWSVPVRLGTTVTLVVGDSRGIGSAGSVQQNVQQGESAVNNTCLNASSPSSTPGSPAGGAYPTGSNGAGGNNGSGNGNGNKNGNDGNDNSSSG